MKDFQLIYFAERYNTIADQTLRMHPILNNRVQTPNDSMKRYQTNLMINDKRPNIHKTSIQYIGMPLRWQYLSHVLSRSINKHAQLSSSFYTFIICVC